jgi:aspartate/methionine/tyrosine aminotransferase
VRLSLLVDELTPFLAMEVMERGLALEAQGHDIVQLAVGQPDGRPPQAALDATARALEAGETQYTESRGSRCRYVRPESRRHRSGTPR